MVAIAKWCRERHHTTGFGNGVLFFVLVFEIQNLPSRWNVGRTIGRSWYYLAGVWVFRRRLQEDVSVCTRRRAKKFECAVLHLEVFRIHAVGGWRSDLANSALYVGEHDRSFLGRNSKSSQVY